MASSSTSGWSYDVFLSFRGTDTRKNFIDHLYTALVQSGIHTFKDDDELPRGHEISSELLKAIQESRISIVVFSKNYGSSRWCLDELVKIMDCKKFAGQLVLPVFYDVDPSDVRKQRGTFEAAFCEHEECYVAEIEKVERWRSALTEAANLSGWDLQNVAMGFEAKFIRKIVDEVLRVVNHTYMHVPECMVGLDRHVEKLNSFVRTETNDVRLVGIYGIGGIGKTTIAKYFYNFEFRQYEGSCFLANVREKSEGSNGLVHLQEQLLSELLMKKKVEIANIDIGISLVKQRLGTKRVLIVLDDVDELDQFESLVGDRRWFANGSLVIITTRNQHLLAQAEVDVKYEVEELSYNESVTLFTWHAFKGSVPLPSYVGLLEDIVRYAGGLPLALEVLGSSLFEKTLVQWKSMFEKLKVIPNKKIQAKLKLSYEALDDDTVKNIFLDIACLFIRINKEYAIKIFDACGFYGDAGISALVDRCLLKIVDNQLKMHDLLRDMGRGIVRESFPKDPGKHTRLWRQDDILDVLTNNKGTDAIEGIILDLVTQTHLSARSFARMRNLRLLKINNVNLDGSFEGLFKELKWLCWYNCPLQSLPTELHLGKLACLDMQRSNLSILWKGKKFLGNLRVMKLDQSRFLTTTPDFSEVPKLEELSLRYCVSLSNIDLSIKCLDKLITLDLANCFGLRSLPSGISSLTSLQILVVQDCSSLEGFPEQLGDLKSLQRLHAERSGIKELPDSIGNLGQLTDLWLNQCQNIKSLPSSISSLTSLERLIVNESSNQEGFPEQLGDMKCLQFLYAYGTGIKELPDSIGNLGQLTELLLNDCQSIKSLPDNLCKLRSLEQLCLDNCSNLERLPEQLGNIEGLKLLSACHTAIKELPLSIGLLHNLESLLLSGNDFCSLPSSITQLNHLAYLELNDCRSLQSVLGLPPNLALFHANDCTSLKTLPNLSRLDLLEKIELMNCRRFVEIQGLENLVSIKSINLEGCTSLEKLPNLSDLEHLEWISLKNCSKLFEIQGLKNLKVFKYINLDGCTSLGKLPNIFNVNSLELLDLQNCSKLVEIQGLENLKHVETIRLGGCSRSLSTTALEHFLFQGPCEQLPVSELYLSRQDIPDCFEHQGMGGSPISFDVPSHVPDDSFHLIIWLDYDAVNDSMDYGEYISIHIIGKTENTKWSYNVWALVGNVSCVIHVPYEHQIKRGDSIKVSFEIFTRGNLKVGKCGVRLTHTSETRSRSLLPICLSEERVQLKRGIDSNVAETSCAGSKRMKETETLPFPQCCQESMYRESDRTEQRP